MTAAFMMLIVTSVCSLSAKHIYMPRAKIWSEAQADCRANFIDLSAITSKTENEAFKMEHGDKSGWIGLYRDSTSPTEYSWSGGGYVNYTEWASFYRNVFIFGFHFYGFWQSSGWLLYSGFIPRDYFCFSLIVIEEKKSWEEALEYCREKHAEITSLVSEHEVLLAQKVIQPNSITDPVWIGLCFLGNRWLWVNGDPLEYQAWTMGEEHSQCLEKGRCGALAKGGQWENRDCQERLSFICY